MPTIATAALATATGFLVLLLSPVPMVRGFGVLLVVGIAIALACALMAVSAAMALAERDGGVVWASLRGADEIVARGRIDPRAGSREESARRAAASPGPRGACAPPPDRPPRDARRRGRASPGRVLAVGAVLAVLGWVADTQTSVQSDVTKLVPSSMPALRDLHLLEHVTGVSGEIDVVVHSHDVATPNDDRLDALLREQAADALRVPRDEGVLEGHPVPGAVAARTCSARARSRRRADARG